MIDRNALIIQTYASAYRDCIDIVDDESWYRHKQAAWVADHVDDVLTFLAKRGATEISTNDLRAFFTISGPVPAAYANLWRHIPDTLRWDVPGGLDFDKQEPRTNVRHA